MKATLAMALFGAALITAPAMAQTQRPADQTTKTERTTDAKSPPLYQMKAGQWRASKLDGLDVYNPNNEKIGDVSELIVDRAGKIEAVVIGVGGFLGMGEHQVAVPFDKVQWVDQPVEHRVSSTDRTTTTGSGTSTATSPAPAGTTTNPSATTHTTTTTDANSGEKVTTTTTERPAGMAQAPATTDRTVTVNRDRTAAADNREYRPDHAVVAMTKDQLKALPEVRYAK
ncbi:MAG: PRC-barrel domain-containing protein [Alphaproteobacteria bacterium]